LNRQTLPLRLFPVRITFPASSGMDRFPQGIIIRIAIIIIG
jgi:hypothetical protein